MIINIHATVSFNSLRYFDYMLANYRGLASGQHELRFLCYCLDRWSHRRLKADPRIHRAVAMPFGRGSLGHAQALERALSACGNGAIDIISDTDIALFMKNWDVALYDALMPPDGLGIIATRLEDIGGFSTGDTPYQQYKKKPSTTWMALSPHYDFTLLQVRPDKENFIAVATSDLSELYQLPIGFFVVKDTGWQIPQYLYDHRIPYLAFDIVKPTDPRAIALRGCNPYHDEFHWNGAPFLAHQRGSMKHRFRIDPLSVDFYDASDRFNGNPVWAVFPNARDRLIAAAEDMINVAKRPLRAVRDSFSGATR